MNRNSKKIKGISIGGVLLFFVILSAESCKKKSIQDPVYSVCTFVGGKRSGRSLYANYIYSVNGKNFEISYGPYNKEFVIGEKFLVVFSKTNPSVAEVQHASPVFLLEEDTKRTFTTDLIIDAFDSTVKFYYVVNNIKYEKTQMINDTTDLKKMDTINIFEVIYLKDNPQRSIVNLKMK